MSKEYKIDEGEVRKDKCGCGSRMHRMKVFETKYGVKIVGEDVVEGRYELVIRKI